MEKQVKKHLVRTGAYYAIVLPVLTYYMRTGQFSAGPCNIGSGLVAFLLAGLASFCLWVYNGLLFLLKNRQYIYSLFFHFTACFVWWVYLASH